MVNRAENRENCKKSLHSVLQKGKCRQKERDAVDPSASQPQDRGRKLE